MPVVPFSAAPGASTAKQPAPISEAQEPWVLMAAATMDAQGRLVESEVPLSRRIDDSIADVRDAEKYSSDKAGKLIDTGIWKRHQGSFPPNQHPDHYFPKDK